MQNYSGIQIIKEFQVIVQDPCVISQINAPTCSDISNEVFVKFSLPFTFATGVTYCNDVTYSLIWLSEKNAIQASLDINNSVINVSSNDRLKQVGTYQFLIRVIVVNQGQSYDIDSINYTLTLTDPCSHTQLISQSIDSSLLACAYDDTCLFTFTSWSDSVDQNNYIDSDNQSPNYGTAGTQKCGFINYSASNQFVGVQYPDDISNLISIDSNGSLTITFTPTEQFANACGKFNFLLNGQMNDYPLITSVQNFSLNILCKENITQNPIVPDFNAPIWVTITTVPFILHQGLDFGSYSYSFVFVSESHGVVATVDDNASTISVTAQNKLMLGSYSYKLVVTFTISQTSYESNIATLKIVDPCSQNSITDQSIDFSSLISGYEQTVTLVLPTFTDSVDQDPQYGTTNINKCGSVQFTVQQNPNGNLITTGDPTAILSIGNDKSSILLTPIAGCSYGTFDFHLIIALADYPDVKLIKSFQAKVVDPCDTSIIIPPVCDDITGEVYTIIQQTFTLSQNISQYCGIVSYTFMWVSQPNDVQASIDDANEQINISTNDRLTQKGQFTFFIRQSIVHNDQTYNFDSSQQLLTLTDPCLHTEVISQEIESSVLTCSYDSTCLFTLTSWMDSVDQNEYIDVNNQTPDYGTSGTQKCGLVNYSVYYDFNKVLYSYDIDQLLSITYIASLALTITPTQPYSNACGFFNFILSGQMNDYPNISTTQNFSVKIVCIENITTNPIAPDFAASIWLEASYAYYTKHQGLDFYDYSYNFVFLSNSKGVIASVDQEIGFITVTASDKSMVGSYQYKLVVTFTVTGTSYDSNIATLEIIDPCYYAEIFDQDINFSSLIAGYELTVTLILPNFTYSVDQDPQYGTTNINKCGSVQFTAQQNPNGNLITTGDPTAILSIGNDKSSIVFTPSAGCSYGTFDFNLIIALADYPDVKLIKFFQVTVIDPCDTSIIILPVCDDITGEVYTRIQQKFTPSQNLSQYCGIVSYTIMWVTQSNDVQASIDDANEQINISSNDRFTQTGQFNFFIRSSIVHNDQTYNFDSSQQVLTLNDPCLHTSLTIQSVDSSQLVCKMGSTCSTEVIPWPDTVDQTETYGQVNTFKCGTKSYQLQLAETNAYPNIDFASLLSIDTSYPMLIKLSPDYSASYGTFNFDLIVWMSDYPNLSSSQKFSVTIQCASNITVMPVVQDFSAIVFLNRNTIPFTLHLGQDCSDFTYSFAFETSSNRILGTVDQGQSTLNAVTQSLQMVKTYQYHVVLTLNIEKTTYRSNTATLTVVDPCLQTNIYDQAIDFSNLNAAYEQSVQLKLPKFSDSVDQDPIFGITGDQKCGQIKFTVQPKAGGNSFIVGDPAQIVTLSNDASQIVFTPSAGCSFGAFDFELVITMQNYSSIQIIKDFQVIVQDPCVISQINAPTSSNISNEVFVTFSSTFTLATGVTYCNDVTYSLIWLSESNAIQTQLDRTNLVINISSNNRLTQVGSYQFLIRVSVVDQKQSYEIDSINYTLTLTDPCLHTELISQAIDSSLLACSYDETCPFTFTSWSDSVDKNDYIDNDNQTPNYGTTLTQKCGLIKYSVSNHFVGVQYPDDIQNLISIDSSESLTIIFTPTESFANACGKFNFELNGQMNDYPLITSVQKFSFDIVCKENITQNPIVPDFNAPIWVTITTVPFNLHQGLDFGSYSYSFVFVSESHGVVATVDDNASTIAVTASNKLMLGSYSYKLVVTFTVSQISYESNISTLKIVDPCTQDSITDQSIDFSSLITGYEQTVILILPIFTDSVDQDPQYGTTNINKCGSVQFTVQQSPNGNLITTGDPTAILSIGNDKSSIVFAPSAGCSYGSFDFNLIIALADYPDVKLIKYFQVTVIDPCDTSIIIPPVCADITGEVYTIIQQKFTQTKNVSQCCGIVSYTFMWVTQSNDVQASIDGPNEQINISSNDKVTQTGQFNFFIRSSIMHNDQAYNFDSSQQVLTLNDPCLNTSITPQSIDSSKLVCKMGNTCSTQIIPWTDTVDQTQIYGAVGAQKCGNKSYYLQVADTYAYPINSFSTLLRLTSSNQMMIQLTPDYSAIYGTFDFDLVVQMDDYPNLSSTQTFSVKILCAYQITSLPTVQDFAATIFLSGNTVPFTPHKGQDCSDFTYSFIFETRDNGVQVTVDFSDSLLKIVASNLSMVGTYQYHVVLTLNKENTTYLSNTASFTISDPCLQTQINDQTIDFSSLHAAYDQTVTIALPIFTDSVDQNPIYGKTGNHKCGLILFSVLPKFGGNSFSVGDPAQIVTISNDFTQILFTPSDGCSFGIFDFQLVVSMYNYQNIQIIKDFFVIVQDPCIISQIVAPQASSISNEVFVSFSSSFTLATGITYCSGLTYQFIWLKESNAVQASLNSTNSVINISSSNRLTQAGSYEFLIRVSVIDQGQSYDFDSIHYTLTLIDPCLHTALINPPIDSSVLSCNYGENCSFFLVSWSDLVDQNKYTDFNEQTVDYGTTSNQKCGMISYSIVNDTVGIQYSYPLSTLLSLDSSKGLALTISPKQNSANACGQFNFALQGFMKDYPTILAASKFQVYVVCNGGITQYPTAPNFNAPIWVNSTIIPFILHQGHDFGSYTYRLIFLFQDNKGVIATVDAATAKITVSAQYKSMVGSYQYYLEVTFLASQSIYKSNTATLQIIDPCENDTIIDQKIEFSTLIASYLETVILKLPRFQDSIDLDPQYGEENTSKCGAVLFSVKTKPSGIIIQVGNPNTIVSIGSNQQSIKLSPTDGCSYGKFDYNLFASLEDYPKVQLVKSFQVIIKDPCDSTVIIPPQSRDIVGEVYTQIYTSFSAAQNVNPYCGPVSNSFFWVSNSTSVQASLNLDSSQIIISSNNRTTQTGTYQFKIRSQIQRDGLYINFDSVSYKLTLTDPCIHTSLIVPTISCSIFNCAYGNECKFKLNSWFDTVSQNLYQKNTGQNPNYGPIDTGKCGALDYSVTNDLTGSYYSYDLDQLISLNTTTNLNMTITPRQLFLNACGLFNLVFKGKLRDYPNISATQKFQINIDCNAKFSPDNLVYQSCNYNFTTNALQAPIVQAKQQTPTVQLVQQIEKSMMPQTITAGKYASWQLPSFFFGQGSVMVKLDAVSEWVSFDTINLQFNVDPSTMEPSPAGTYYIHVEIKYSNGGNQTFTQVVIVKDPLNNSGQISTAPTLSVNQTISQTQQSQFNQTSDKINLKAEMQRQSTNQTIPTEMAASFQADSSTIVVRFDQNFEFNQELIDVLKQLFQVYIVQKQVQTQLRSLQSLQSNSVSQSISYTWDLTVNNQTSEIKIKLNFSNPWDVSVGDDIHKVKLSINNNMLEQLNKISGEKLLILPFPLDTDWQLQAQINPKESKKLQTIVYILISCAELLLLLSLISSIFTGGTTSLVWSLIGSIQLVSFMAIFNLNYPGPYNFFMNQLMRIATFNYIGNGVMKPWYDFVKKKSTHIDEMDFFNQRFFQMGFKISNPIVNLHSAIIAVFILVCLALMHATSYCCSLKKLSRVGIEKLHEPEAEPEQEPVSDEVIIPIQKHQTANTVKYICTRNFMSKTKINLGKLLFWNYTVRNGIELFAVFFLASSIRIATREMDTIYEALLTIFNYIWFSALVGFVVWTGFKTQLNRMKLEDQEYQEKYGQLTVDCHPKRPGSYLMTPLFLIERIIIIVAIVFLQNYSIFQIQTMIIISILKLNYLVQVLPYKENILNYVEILNALLVQLCAYYTVLFSQFTNDNKLRYEISYGLILIVFLFILFNIIIMLYKIVVNLKGYLRVKITMKRTLRRLTTEVVKTVQESNKSQISESERSRSDRRQLFSISERESAREQEQEQEQESDIENSRQNIRSIQSIHSIQKTESIHVNQIQGVYLDQFQVEEFKTDYNNQISIEPSMNTDNSTDQFMGTQSLIFPKTFGKKQVPNKEFEPWQQYLDIIVEQSSTYDQRSNAQNLNSWKKGSTQKSLSDLVSKKSKKSKMNSKESNTILVSNRSRIPAKQNLSDIVSEKSNVTSEFSKSSGKNWELTSHNKNDHQMKWMAQSNHDIEEEDKQSATSITDNSLDNYEQALDQKSFQISHDFRTIKPIQVTKQDTQYQDLEIQENNQITTELSMNTENGPDQFIGSQMLILPQIIDQRKNPMKLFELKQQQQVKIEESTPEKGSNALSFTSQNIKSAKKILTEFVSKKSHMVIKENGFNLISQGSRIPAKENLSDIVSEKSHVTSEFSKSSGKTWDLTSQNSKKEWITQSNYVVEEVQKNAASGNSLINYEKAKVKKFSSTQFGFRTIKPTSVTKQDSRSQMMNANQLNLNLIKDQQNEDTEISRDLSPLIQQQNSLSHYTKDSEQQTSLKQQEKSLSRHSKDSIQLAKIQPGPQKDTPVKFPYYLNIDNKAVENSINEEDLESYIKAAAENQDIKETLDGMIEAFARELTPVQEQEQIKSSPYFKLQPKIDNSDQFTQPYFSNYQHENFPQNSLKKSNKQEPKPNFLEVQEETKRDWQSSLSSTVVDQFQPKPQRQVKTPMTAEENKSISPENSSSDKSSFQNLVQMNNTFQVQKKNSDQHRMQFSNTGSLILQQQSLSLQSQQFEKSQSSLDSPLKGKEVKKGSPQKLQTHKFEISPL